MSYDLGSKLSSRSSNDDAAIDIAAIITKEWIKANEDKKGKIAKLFVDDDDTKPAFRFLAPDIQNEINRLNGTTPTPGTPSPGTPTPGTPGTPMPAGTPPTDFSDGLPTGAGAVPLHSMDGYKSVHWIPTDTVYVKPAKGDVITMPKTEYDRDWNSGSTSKNDRKKAWGKTSFSLGR